MPIRLNMRTIVIITVFLFIAFIACSEEHYSFKTPEECSLAKWNTLVDTFQSNPLEYQLQLRECKVGNEPRTKGMMWGVNLQNIADSVGVNSSSFNRLATLICKSKQYEPISREALHKDLRTFVTDFNIDLNRAELCKYTTTQEECFSKFKTMDEFFSRDINRDILRTKISELKSLGVNGDNTILSPADSYCMIFPTEDIAKQIWIKGNQFSVMTMIGNQTLYRDAPGVSIVINRLAPGHYHKFHCPISGEITTITRLGSNYLSVQPAIVQHQNVYTENVRVVCQIKTKQFGTVSMVIVGASCVGSVRLDGISSLHTIYSDMVYQNEMVRELEQPISVKSGQLLGSFHYGGSTVVLVIPITDKKYQYNPYILSASQKGIETEIPVLEPLLQL